MLGSTPPTCRRSTPPRPRGCAKPLSATQLRRQCRCIRAAPRSSADWQSSHTDHCRHAPTQVSPLHHLHLLKLGYVRLWYVSCTDPHAGQHLAGFENVVLAWHCTTYAQEMEVLHVGLQSSAPCFHGHCCDVLGISHTVKVHQHPWASSSLH